MSPASMIHRIAFGVSLMAAVLPPVGAQTCQTDKPRQIVGAKSYSLAGQASLIGFSEFTSPSTPPKKYRRKEISGTMYFAQWGGSDCNVPAYPPAYDHQGVHVVGSVGNRVWYHWNIRVEPVEINVLEGSILYRVTRFDSYKVGENPAVTVYNVHRVAGGLQLLTALGHERWASIGRAYTLWVDTGGGSPTIMDNSTFTIGTFYMQQWRDEWRYQREYAKDDPSGTTFATNTDTSAHYAASSASFPLSTDGAASGVPSTGSYGGFTNGSITAVRREMIGTEICNPVPGTSNSRGKMSGAYREELSQEDTEEDAMRRAFLMDQDKNPVSTAVHWGSDPTAYRVKRNDGFDIGFSDVNFEVPVNITCEGEYQVHLNFRKRAHGGTDAGMPFSRTIEQHFKPGQITLKGHFDVREMRLMFPDGSSDSIEYDTDYTFLGATIGRGCEREDAGSPHFRRDSVHVRLSLGHGVAGHTAGALLLDGERITPVIYSSRALAPDVPVGGNTIVVRDPDGAPRQMKAPAALADIVTLDPASYEVRFYAEGDVGPVDSITGIYAVTGSPYVVFRFENPDAASGEASRLRISESRGNVTKVTQFDYDAARAVWSFSQGNGLRRESTSIEENLAAKTRIEHLAILGQDAEVVSKVDRTYFAYPWGDEIIKEVTDPDGAALTTTFVYFSTANEPGYGLLHQKIDPDGSSETYTYDLAGRPLRTERPFTTGLSSPFSEPQARVVETIYDTLPDADGDGLPEKITTSVETTLGRETARSCVIDWTQAVQLGGEAFNRRSDIRCISAGAAWNAPGNLTTETLSHVAGPFAGRNRRVLYPDGTTELTSHAIDGAGQTSVTVLSGAPNTVLDDIVSGLRAVTFTNAQGRTVGEATTDIASGRLLLSWTATQIDTLGRPVRLDYSDGTYETRDYACCGLATLRDRTGMVSSYQYDELGRQTDVTRDGLTTHTAYDAEGRVKSVTRLDAGKNAIVQERNAYDLAGRLVQRRDAMDRLTTISETVDAATGHTTRTTINPDQGTRIEVMGRGGSLLGIGGSAVAPHRYDYGVDTDGSFTRETRMGEGGAATEWTKSYTDFAGRALKTVYADGATSRSYYNAAGQLVRQIDPDGVSQLFAYNSRGEQEVVAVDMDGNGLIDFGGTDRITRTINEVGLHETHTVQRRVTQIWETAGLDAPVTVSVAEQSTDGSRAWEMVRGLVTATVVAYDGVGGRTVTVTAPDGVQSIQAYSGDRLTSSTRQTATAVRLAAVTNEYDAFGRLRASTDARNGTSTYTYNDDDTVASFTSPDPAPGRSGPGYDPQTTAYLYDEAGRLGEVIEPDGSVIHTTYWPTGAVKRTWGARTYPVEYTYDPQGRVRTMTTWQDFAADSGRAVTTWNYNPQRGWLETKRYADNTGPSYTYKPSGRLLTRLWARGVLTSYGYNAAGDFSGTSYSDGTPPVSLAQDRSGRPSVITDASGTRTLSYHASGRLQDELCIAGRMEGFGLSRSYDHLGRLEGVSALPAQGSSPAVTSYSYDSASRLAVVTRGVNTATYAYESDSPLVRSITFAGDGVARLTTTRTYDNLSRLTGISSQISDLTSQISTTYTYNAANQRITIEREDASRWDYSYDALGQVVSGRKSMANGAVLPGHDFGWTYDDIGNRRTAKAGARISNYSANSLNQYARRTVPGSFDLLAAAEPDARVSYKYPDDTGTWTPLPRVGGMLYQELTADNAPGGANAKVRVMGVRGNAGPDGQDVVTDITVATYLPQTPLVYGHDLDGNLTSDGRWICTWDGENRLSAMETSIPAVAVGIARRRLEFDYDGQGRRFAKKVYSWDTAAGGWTLDSSYLFLYDGWNLMATHALNPQASAFDLACIYVWGLDVSGSLQGAGGVGGLLFAGNSALNSPLQAPCYDGNGNIIGLIDLVTGARSATYEYSAFGEAIIADGPAAATNPFRFSTKYTDEETGLLYYGFRYYSSSTGRWLSRDPIEEEGGLNLYSFLTNAPIRYVDKLGLLLAAVDGTGSLSWRFFDQKTGRWNSHVRNFFIDYQGPGPKRYWDGPANRTTGADSPDIHKEVIKWICISLRDTPLEPINLIGHSRGGYIMMQIAKELKEKGCACVTGQATKTSVRVNFLGLYDPVDMVIGYGEGEKVTSNVDYAANAFGDPKVGSRPYFNTADGGAEDLSKMKSYRQEYFDATHGGMGGDPWGGDQPRGMTEARDRAGSSAADVWMRERARNAGIQLRGSP